MSRDKDFDWYERWLDRVFWASVVVLVLTIAIDWAMSPARAHEWYPPECCSDRDCWIAGVGGAEPEPRSTPSGWVLHDGTLVPYHEARPSPDGRFHVCRHGGSVQGAVIRAGRVCLWAPQGAS